MKVIGFAGWSGAGKTTLLSRLIPVLIARGLTVSTIKHAHHAFDVDTPGKDSHTHRMVGAQEVLVASAVRWALMHELRDAPEPDLPELLGHLAPVDLVLIEGYKRDHHPKIEIHRPKVGKPLLFPEDPHIVAIACDESADSAALSDVDLPVIDLNDTEAVADMVLRHAVPIESVKWREPVQAEG
ncbi:molybdopterin-guanine dinucleotide biosynthesis protein B [Ancylobacter sp. 6x-1]|uniref:Molybdopterin-guanine dinucleotide biosynthesis protein B n=1 Tax=Ancylobacter crimeensis TaxID=2579147 RepID=A0ABT0DCV8_9HYPH|nr:molybdopterin-guanine dinucleotide biosynthesis protein B [Ancylobacter crimeensis]MCK0197780.1 molybdopterin-guanine dinucleotide biosynthesis protein B [Ancylobacter crimeensis]